MVSSQGILKTLQKRAVSAGWVYFTFLFGWLAAYLLRGDWDGLLVLVNALAAWLFLPLPFFLGLAVLSRRVELWLAGAIVLAVWLYLWGGLFLPRARPAAAQAGDPAPSLRVMTYNVYGFNGDAEGVIAAIRSVDPDVICLQELNLEIAAALEATPAEEYPYRVLDPRAGVDGMGTISKYPIRPGRGSLAGEWIGTPQVMELDWNGITVELVNFHMHPPGRLTPGSLRQRHAIRQQQAAALSRFATEADQPLILAGDANATELNDAYKKIMAADLRDAWNEAGAGMGFTFPRQMAGYSPTWMARIDHVFLSLEWEILKASLAPIDPGSDHRGIWVEARLPHE